MPRRIRDAAIVLLACSVLPVTVPAQQPVVGSRQLSVEHWAYEYLERLEARGLLPGLNPLVQPYRRAEVARELARLDPDTLPEPVSGWVRVLKAEFGGELGVVAARGQRPWGVEAMAGAHASTSRRLDPARPLGGGQVWPWWRGGGWIETGPLAAETRVYGDMYFNDDPDGLNPGQALGGRSDNAYASVAWPFGGAILGRFARNWGPVRTPGLMVSDVATPYPQIGLDLRVGSFTLRAFTGELETLGGLKRHIAAHRVDYQRPDLVVSFGEANLYAHSGGGPLLRFLNPVEFLFFDEVNEPTDAVQNLMLNAQAWLRRSGAVFYAEWLLDDIDVRPEGPRAAPPRYGFTLRTSVTSLGSWVEPGAEYQQVSAWAYRTTALVDRYSYLNRGLGANYSDYDRLSLWADLYPPVRGLSIAPHLVFQRQGEGNFRDSIPGGLEGKAALFLRTTETTLRVAVRGRYQPIRQLWVGWDIGPNWVRNQTHRLGVNQTDLEATGEIGVRLDFPRAIPR